MTLKNLLSWIKPKFNFRLLPKHHLKAGNIYPWQATGDDPFFHLKHKGRAPQGWYMLNISATASISNLTAKLYYSSNSELNEQTAISFTLFSGKLQKRVVFFEKSAKFLRFDPSEYPCEFRIDELSLTKLTVGRARQLMLKKMQGRRDISALTVHSEVELLNLYQQCFNRHNGLLTYQQWRSQYAQQWQPSRLKAIYDSLNSTPTFSIVLPTYNTPLTLLKKCIESVQRQIYPHWQLCIADDASSNPNIAEFLTALSSGDPRILVTLRKHNGHISEASNSALAMASGEYVGLLDHDDELAPHALLMMAQAIRNQPDAGLLYSDEDKIDEQGQRRDPHFKPDWNRDLFYSHNYITHFCVFKKAILTRVGGFRKGMEGSQDYDLLLRAISLLGNRQIVHVPHILYHWRAINGSTALNSSEKSYSQSAGKKALTDFFKPTNILVKVQSHTLNNCYRVEWPLPDILPFVSLIIPTRDNFNLLKNCIDSIYQKTSYPHFEIIVVNNQSKCKKTLSLFQSLAASNRARIMNYDKPFNFSVINNIAVEQAKGSIIGLINNDIEIKNKDWLTEMVRHASRPDIGCVGAKLYYPDGRIQHAGVVLGIGGVAGHSHKYFSSHHHGYHSRLSLVQNYSAVTGAALLVRKSVYQEVGGLEPKLQVAFNDIDFCLKVRQAGYRNLWTPFAELIHHESLSRGYEDSPDKIERFNREVNFMKVKWGDNLLNDPFYNPNLTLLHEDFSYRVT
ncbi:glycosyltransferase family 2 protein [Aeromonas veronii]|uniref:glycosyltransferase family 2 protein n=1 Tax=Aeromonas veronii TaxID=654 RepID=UPI0038DB8BFA